MPTSPKKYIVTVDLDGLPPLKSGLVPYDAFPDFPNGNNLLEETLISLRRLWTLLKWARDCEVMVLDSVSGKIHPDLLACIFMRFLPKRPVVIMADDMWNKGNFFKYNFQKLMIQLADPCIQRYAVHSLGEEKIFASLWGISPKKVKACIYNFTFTDAEINAGAIAKKGYIFAGGNPSRDYVSLIEAARQLPHRKFIIATRVFDKRSDIPQNVSIVKVSHTEFITLMREADMVITPLVTGETKSAGQQTYLNAMRMGKISIVNGKDVLGVTDYIENYVNGIIPDGTPKEYCDVIEWVYDPANQEAVQRIEKLAQETVMQFTYQRYLQTMTTIIEEAIDEVKNPQLSRD